MFQLAKTHPRYQKYNPTNIDWIGDIPDGWNIPRINTCLTVSRKSVSQNELKSMGGQVFHYSIPSIQEHGTGSIEDANSIDSNKFVLEGNELLVSKLNPRKDTVLIVEKQKNLTVCSTEFVVMRANIGFLIRYGYYFFKSSITREKICSFVQSATKSHGRVNPSDIYKLKIPLPDEHEQRKIIAYLDEKTALLDQAITKKKQQIEFLSEHRTALINNAITKGLDPNAEMKDTGVEWIGMIPKEWKVKKLKYVVSNKNQKTPFSSDMFCVALENIESWTGKYLPTEGDKVFETDMNSFEKGDVLFGKLRPYLAKAYKTTSHGLCVGEFLVLRPSNEILQDYLYYRTISSDFITQVNNSTFGAKMPRADWGFIGNLTIGVPSTKEQKEIIDYLKKETAYIDLMKEKIEQSIELLQEYKTSLISHAVSGKIKVS